MPCTTQLKDVKFKPKGIILSGSPYSVHDKDSPHADPGRIYFYITSVRRLSRLAGIGMVKMAKIRGENASADALFEGLGDEMQVCGCRTVASCTGRWLSSLERKLHGFERYVARPCNRCRKWGVDSTVAAKLMHEAIGDSLIAFRFGKSLRWLTLVRFHAIMVDNGVLRLNEVNEMLNKNLGVILTDVDASELFLSRLEDIEDPEQRRKIISDPFINVFEAVAAEEERKNGAAAKRRVEWLLQGTLYPNVIESTIKTHRNVGGLLKDMKLKLIEPLRELFEGDIHEVRVLDRLLAIPAPLVRRHPFSRPRPHYPNPGTVTREQVIILQQADNIYIDKIRKAAVGAMSDARTYEQATTTCLSILAFSRF
ncbi:GMP synthase [Mycena venus]|uniref:GMP synthase n=1 Tax=Mycena venus TaxID=2733690 RepID=A0A8H7CIY7_9AGAR|nr:GMP synthase [Mycena venus]